MINCHNHYFILSKLHRMQSSRWINSTKLINIFYGHRRDATYINYKRLRFRLIMIISTNFILTHTHFRYILCTYKFVLWPKKKILRKYETNITTTAIGRETPRNWRHVTSTWVKTKYDSATKRGELNLYAPVIFKKNFCILYFKLWLI